MTLNQTQYPNNSRVVSGTPAIFKDDVVLLCDTSSASVIINLLEIPDNYWNTTWKLYIIDISSNASVNNIIINAGSGQTINNESSIILSTNGSSVIVRIVSNNKYILEGFPIEAYNTVQDEGVSLPQRSIIDFQGTGVTATDNGSKTIVTVNQPSQQAYNTVQDEGVVLPQRSIIDFQGAGITATDNGSKTIVTVNQFVSNVQSSCNCESLANNADIWAIIDVTSGPYNGWNSGIVDAATNVQTLASAIYSWFAQYQIDNPSYTGQLYVCSTFDERYLGYLIRIRDYNLHLSLCDPSTQDTQFIGSNGLPMSQPANWGQSTWVIPTSILLIPFVNESNPDYHFSSLPPTLSSQPFSNFITDFNSFQSCFSPGPTSMTYFKAVLYPANDGFSAPINSLLHQFAVLNNTDITLSELQNQLGFNYTNYLSSWSGVAVGSGSNPYKSTQYYLGQYGWFGVLNKSVISGLINFTPAQFANDLNTILNGGVLYCESVINNYNSTTGLLELRGLSSNTISINNDNGCLKLESTLQTLDEGVLLSSNTKSINFTGNGVTASESNDNIVVNIQTIDTGWVNLLGFSYMSGATFRPQCRRIGNQVFFRGVIQIPMGNADDGANGTAISVNQPDAYRALAYGKTLDSSLTGNNDACQIYAAQPGSSSPLPTTALGPKNQGVYMFFNRGLRVIPTSVLDTGINFDRDSTTGNRQFIFRNIDVGSQNVYLSSIAGVFITSTGLLGMTAPIGAETFNQNGIINSSMQRNVVSNIISGQNIPIYNPTAPSINNANTTTTYNANITGSTATWPFSMNCANAFEMGGFSVRIDTLVNFL